MRTTVNIDDSLLRAARLRAAETHQTLSAVIENALRIALDPRGSRVTDRWVRVPTAGSGGLLPGVDLDDSASVLDRIEGRG